MLVDLVKVTTRDGLTLDGIYQEPQVNAALSIAGFCLVHGTGSNFYSSSLLSEIAELILELGCGVLRVNSRGHDGISTAVTATGGKRQGAAYEVIDDCRHDLAAWAEWLRSRVGPRIGLIGHSMGGIKVIHAATRENSINPACLIAISPPRLCYESFATGLQGAQFLETFNHASRLVESGQPAALLQVQIPMPYVITAAGYIEKYGPDDRYDFLKMLNGLACPAMITLGSKEIASNMAFQGLPHALQPLLSEQSSLKIKMIEGADHFYSGARDPLISSIRDWLHENSGN